ncbi:MAG: DUF5106 domain-containing protein [Muribaculaceae bacterium]|nr:DUF5106 domain-containing protein [Muribaculaceae bacterium]
MKFTTILLLASFLYAATASHSGAYTAESPQKQTIKELPLPKVPVSLTDPAGRADYILSHFWDALDFDNAENQLDSPSLEQNFVNYLNLFPHADSDSLPGIVNSFLYESEKNANLAKQIYDLAYKYLDTKESPLRNETYYIYFLENAKKSKACDEATRERASYRLEAAMKNRPGADASDFRFITRDGKQTSLSALASDSPILLIFYDPDCSHCSETINEIIKLHLGNTKIVAIDSEEDRELWDNTKNTLPDSWTVGFAIDPVQDDEIYVFEEMPTIFLLDKDKKIILKDATIQEIKNTISGLH